MEQNVQRIRVEIRLKADEKEKLWASAKKRGVTPSELLRQFINTIEN